MAAQDVPRTSTSYPFLGVEHHALVETILAPECNHTPSAKPFLREDLPTELSAAIASFCLETAV